MNWPKPDYKETYTENDKSVLVTSEITRMAEDREEWKHFVDTCLMAPYDKENFEKEIFIFILF